jgi:hypothetical protein
MKLRIVLSSLADSRAESVKYMQTYSAGIKDHVCALI